jgi:MoaA/NifB/PqqE/SkfB family radical SAM enzyme
MTDSSYIKKKRYNILWEKESPESPLLSTIDLELTERCNNNCIHCNINLPKNDRKAESRELTYDQWKHILDQAAELGVLSVRFTGGEPLLREDFSYLYLHARSIGMKVIIFTNACLLTEEIADMLTRVPPLEKIEITAYGMKQDSYEAVTRKQGSYNAFKNGVSLLLDREVPFIVKSAILPPNKHEIDEFDRWANTMPWMDTLPSYSFSFDLRGRRDSKSKNQQIKALRLTPEEELKIMTRDIVKYKKEMKQFCNNFIGPPGDELFNCGAGRSGCVDAYGMYQP